VARALPASGVSVTLAGGRAAALEELAKELRSTGQAEGIARRPDSAQDTDEMVRAAVDAHGGLDFFFTAAGENKPEKIEQQDPGDWQEIIDANVRGTWLTCRSAGRHMIEAGRGGRFVLVSSTRGRLGLAAGYSA